MRTPSARLVTCAVVGFILARASNASPIPMTLEDFHVPGTQVGDVSPGMIATSVSCSACHGNFNPATEPYKSWQGSLMGQAGRDPLFYAQMSTANQDVDNVGYYCLRCHVPMSVVTGHANQPLGDTLDEFDRDGVNCHFCHSMVDPIYKPGVSPPVDQGILNSLAQVPGTFGNAMFVLDPSGTRRGPYADASLGHQTIVSSFMRSGDMCGTCHDVGNVATTKQPDGTYRYNAIETPNGNPDPWAQFPLERTYTEWKLSAYANGGVNAGGRFGGSLTTVSTCQDCHMPTVSGQGCFFGPTRTDLKRHDFSGAAAQVLDLIAWYTQGDPAVDQDAITLARGKAVDMLQRAATLSLARVGLNLRVRVTNESGHKLPTGHIEGRRVWVNVKFFDAQGQLVGENGAYDDVEAELDEASTTVFEMHVGLSDYAAGVTGLPAGPTGHMSLADTIVKDNRIPPRGFSNAQYAAGGAPVVGTTYADGQHWADVRYAVPTGATRAVASLYYQNTPRHYIDELRHNNHSNNWGEVLHSAWTATGRGAPILMASAEFSIPPVCAGDANGDFLVNGMDLSVALSQFGSAVEPGSGADYNGDGVVTGADLSVLLGAFGSSCD